MDLIFQPDTDYSGWAAIAVHSCDLGQTGSGGWGSDTDKVDIAVGQSSGYPHVNQPPQNTVPTPQTGYIGTPLVFSQCQ